MWDEVPAPEKVGAAILNNVVVSNSGTAVHTQKSCRTIMPLDEKKIQEDRSCLLTRVVGRSGASRTVTAVGCCMSVVWTDRPNINFKLSTTKVCQARELELNAKERLGLRLSGHVGKCARIQISRKTKKP